MLWVSVFFVSNMFSKGQLFFRVFFLFVSVFLGGFEGSLVFFVGRDVECFLVFFFLCFQHVFYKVVFQIIFRVF